MAHYEVEFKNIKKRDTEWLETHEFDWPFFTKTAFDNVVCTLFFYAAQSTDYNNLDAIVKRDGEKVLHFTMDTKTDGSTVYSILRAARPREKYRYIRTMIVAD